MAARIEKGADKAGKRLEEEVRRLIDEMVEVAAENIGKREILSGFDNSVIKFCATKIVYCRESITFPTLKNFSLISLKKFSRDMLMKGLPTKFDDYIMYR